MAKHYHCIEERDGLFWRQECGVLDELVEDCVEAFGDGKVSFGVFVDSMERYLSAASVLSKKGLLSHLALNNYRTVYDLVVQQYVDSRQDCRGSE